MFNKNWWFLNFQKEFLNFSFCIRKLAVAFYMINEIQAKIKFQNIVQCPFNQESKNVSTKLNFVLLTCYCKYKCPEIEWYERERKKRPIRFLEALWSCLLIHYMLIFRFDAARGGRVGWFTRWVGETWGGGLEYWRVLFFVFVFVVDLFCFCFSLIHCALITLGRCLINFVCMYVWMQEK